MSVNSRTQAACPTSPSDPMRLSSHHCLPNLRMLASTMLLTSSCDQPTSICLVQSKSSCQPRRGWVGMLAFGQMAGESSFTCFSSLHDTQCSAAKSTALSSPNTCMHTHTCCAASRRKVDAGAHPCDQRINLLWQAVLLVARGGFKQRQRAPGVDGCDWVVMFVVLRGSVCAHLLQ